LASFGALFQFGCTNIVYRKRETMAESAGLGKAGNNDDDDGGDDGDRGAGRRDEGEKRRAAARNAARERARRRERERDGERERKRKREREAGAASSSSSSSSGGGGGSGGFRRGQVTGRESRAARSVDRTKLPPMPRGGGDGDGGGSITPCRALTMANESERTLPPLLLLLLLTVFYTVPFYAPTSSMRFLDGAGGAWSNVLMSDVDMSNDA
ncbi:hypothetical protein ALC62_13161, partial [Cyphomyrmex costatus]